MEGKRKQKDKKEIAKLNSQKRRLEIAIAELVKESDKCSLEADKKANELLRHATFLHVPGILKWKEGTIVLRTYGFVV